MKKILYTFFALFVALAMISCSDNGVDIIDIGNGDDNGNGDDEGAIYSVTFNVEGGGQFTFSVDMEDATIEGDDLPENFEGDVYTFDPENDKVVITGSLLDWAQPGTDGSVTLTKSGASGGTIEAGSAQFKFFIVPPGVTNDDGVNASWEYGEWEGDPNRSVDIESGGDFHAIWGDQPEVEPSAAPEALYMIGQAVGGWDWEENGIEMIPMQDKDTFWRIVWLEAGDADGGFKFAPENNWDTGEDFGFDGNDPIDEIYKGGTSNVPAPEVSGYYMVVVNWTENDTEDIRDNFEIAVTEPLVYLIGETVGSWDTAFEDALFTVDNENEVISITRELAAEELRMYAWFDKGWFTEWWQSEFMIFDGEIEYRGDGDDQDRVNIDAEGEYTIELNFRTGAGSVVAN